MVTGRVKGGSERRRVERDRAGERERGEGEESLGPNKRRSSK